MPDRGVRCPDPRSRKGDHEPRYEGRWACMFCGAVLRFGTWHDPLDIDGEDHA